MYIGLLLLLLLLFLIASASSLSPPPAARLDLCMVRTCQNLKRPRKVLPLAFSIRGSFLSPMLWAQPLSSSNDN